ncbi:MAG: AAA family ATPase [Candidatus Sungiibacteriota bacterium]
MAMILKPCVVVLSGMPLMGKSALAAELIRMTNLIHIDVDEIRQMLFPNPDRIVFPSTSEFAVMESCYDLLIKNAEWIVEQLRIPVCVTGTFSREEFKAPLKRMWKKSVVAIPFRIFLLSASDEEITQRVEKRRREGSASNIDTMEKFLWAKGFFQPVEFARVVRIQTIKPPDECAQEVLGYLADLVV